MEMSEILKKFFHKVEKVGVVSDSRLDRPTGDSVEAKKDGQDSLLVHDDKTLSPLCRICSAVLEKYPQVPNHATILSTKERPEDRAIQGCHLCAAFVEMRISPEPSQVTNTTSTIGTIEYKKGGDSRSQWDKPSIVIIYNNIQRSMIDRLTLLPEHHVHSLRESLNLSSIGDSTASVESMALAKRWLDDCEMHQECNTYGGTPTRLIDLGDETSRILRLCISEEFSLSRSTKYMTLSHCWGKDLQYRLLKGSLEAMKMKIHFSELPKTFQEAITVTRHLRVRYLWIDALCIIQDSAEDWQKESSQMDSVYMNSFCNLCATASNDGSGGLFNRRNSSAARRVRLRMRTMPGEDLQVFSPYDAGSFVHEVNDAPLNRRAWVLQERILSRKNLHFGSSQLYWECGKVTASEVFPEGLPFDMRSVSVKRELSSSLRRAPAKFPSHKGDDERTEIVHRYHKHWAGLVELYSKGKLTYQTDRLVAIAGIASLFNTAIATLGIFDNFNDGPAYLSGLWNHNRRSQLLWSVTNPGSMKGSKPRSDYVAPSWTWASIADEVKDVYIPFDYSISSHLISIASMSTRLKSRGDIYGQVLGGNLVVKGKLGMGYYCGKPRGFGTVQLGFSAVKRDERPSIFSDHHKQKLFDFHTDDVDGLLSSGELIYILPIRASLLNHQKGALLTKVTHFFNPAISTGVGSPDDHGSDASRKSPIGIEGLFLKSAKQVSARGYTLEDWVMPSEFQRIGMWRIDDFNLLEGDIEYCDKLMRWHTLGKPKWWWSGNASKPPYPAYSITII